MDPLQPASLEERTTQVSTKKKPFYKRFARILIVVLLLALFAFAYFRYFFVFGDGVKSGHLNYAVKKGNIFKTYEGKLIQEGIRSRTAGSIQSYEFEFSIKKQKNL